MEQTNKRNKTSDGESFALCCLEIQVHPKQLVASDHPKNLLREGSHYCVTRSDVFEVLKLSPIKTFAVLRESFALLLCTA